MYSSAMKNTILAFIVIGLSVGGCRTTPTNPPADQQPPAVQEQPQPQAQNIEQPKAAQNDAAAKEAAKPPADAAKATPQEKGNTPAAKPQDDSEKILRDFRDSKTREEQELRFRSEAHVKQAQAYLAAGNLEKARMEAEEALKLFPQNLEAQDVLRRVGDLSTKKPDREYPEKEIQIATAALQQSELEIKNCITNGENFYMAREYDKSLKELEEAEIKLMALPDFSQMKAFAPDVRKKILEIKDVRRKSEAKESEFKRQKAESEAAERAKADQREMIITMRNRLNLAYLSFSQKRFDQTVQLCDQILWVDPNYRVAMELKADALKAKYKDEWYNTTIKRIEAWKNMVDSQDEATIPYAPSVVFPKRDVWLEISKRLAGMEFHQEEGPKEEEDVDILNMNSVLKRIKVSLDYNDADIPTIKTRLERETKLNFVIDNVVVNSPNYEKRISFRLDDVPAAMALKIFLQHYGLTYKIENSAVIITTPEKAMGKSRTAVYNVTDLLALDGEEGFSSTVEDPATKPALPNRSAGKSTITGLIPSVQKSSASRKINADKLLKLITTNIAPGTWDDRSGHTAIVTPNNMLVVNHVQDVQRNVSEFLQNARSYAGTIVSVKARFYTIDNNFLEDIGVDWRNLPRILGDDIGGDTNSAPGLRATGSSGELYDLRAMTFHTWLRSGTAGNPWTGQLARSSSTPTPLGESGVGGLLAERENPLGSKLGDVGGLGLQYQWLGEAQLNMVLRALSKREKSELLWEPQLTVFDGQRANIMILKQWSYIQDYDAQTGTFAGVMDPVIGILQDGAIFDVRPVVSHDRKYVTMELRPSLVLLQMFRQFVLIPPGAPIQLPWIVYEKVETTVQCPDRGGIIIAGMRDIVSRDLNSSTPILGEIPILQFFFSRKVKSDERRRVIILVSPEIIDLAEYEARQVM